jgi:putative flippase GtrA
VAVASTSRPCQRAWGVLFFGATGSLPHQFARYLVAGGLAFVVDASSLYLLTQFVGLYYLTSAAIGFLFGLVTVYYLNRFWVFDRRTLENAALEFLAFSVIGVVGLGSNEVIIWFVSDKIHSNYMVGKAISAGVVLLWNFGARKLLLFR